MKQSQTIHHLHLARDVDCFGHRVGSCSVVSASTRDKVFVALCHPCSVFGGFSCFRSARRHRALDSFLSRPGDAVPSVLPCCRQRLLSVWTPTGARSEGNCVTIVLLWGCGAFSRVLEPSITSRGPSRRRRTIQLSNIGSTACESGQQDLFTGESALLRCYGRRTAEVQQQVCCVEMSYL